MWFYFLTDSEFSCLAKLAKPYPVFGPAYMPQIPNQLHCIPNCAHEVLITILLGQTVVSFHIKTICFVYKRLMLCI